MTCLQPVNLQVTVLWGLGSEGISIRSLIRLAWTKCMPVCSDMAGMDVGL